MVAEARVEVKGVVVRAATTAMKAAVAVWAAARAVVARAAVRAAAATAE